MWRTAARPTVAAALFLTATACGETGDRGGTVPAVEVPTFEGAIDLEIGRMDGDDPHLFSNILDVAADERGRVLVADRDAAEIRVFEPDGEFAFRFGGLGEGPGEFTDLCCMEFGPDWELWVRESQRFSVFRLAAAGAEYRRGLRSPNLGVIGVAPFTFDREGRLVAVGSVVDDEGPSLFARFRVLPDGVVDTLILADRERQSTSQTTVPRTFGNMRGLVYLHRPFGPQWIHAHAKGGAWAEAVTGEYSVNYHHADGTASVIVGPAFQGPALSEDDRTWAQGWMDRQIKRAGIEKHPFEIPDRKPPLARMFFDRAGRLWIERTAPAGASVREADVYDGTTLAARYRWPRRIQDFPRPWVTESTLYGVTSDSLGVQRVARVRFVPKS